MLDTTGCFRWEHTVAELEEKMGYLIGDVLIASAFLSYAGPFLSNYREDLVQKTWMVEVSCCIHILPVFCHCGLYTEIIRPVTGCSDTQR